MIGNYYNNGDSIIKIIDILTDSLNNKIFICLRYSVNHSIYNIEIMNSEYFNRYYSLNNLYDFEFDDLDYRGLIS